MPVGKLWKQYIQDIKNSFDELNEHDDSQTIFTEENIAKLPALVRQHIINGGYLNRPAMKNMLVNFHNTKFKISAGNKPINIKFMQVNFTKRPDRNAFLKSKIFGIPLEAKDSVIDGHGSMTVTLAKLFQLFNATGSEMDQSQLITALADAVYLPSLFLENFVSLKTLDDHSVEGRITWKGVSARGIFTFDNSGSIIRFDTGDRYMDTGKTSSLTPWYVTYSNYREQNGYFQPGSISVNWALPDSVDTYFTSDNIEIKYSILPLPLTFCL